MKILLINPPLHGMYKAAKVIIPPIGLLYVASYLRANGHDVEVFDNTTRQGPIDYSRADIIGVTSMTQNFPEALEYAREAKEAGKPVMMGGVHVSCSPSEALMSGGVDYVIRGEGEETALDLINALEAGKRHFNPRDIDGLSWLDHETSTIVHNRDRVPIENLDTLPYPARDLLDIGYYKQTTLNRTKPAITLLTSRGCPYKCNFCVVPKINSRKWREREVGSVVDEIESLQTDFGFEAIIFVDDILTINAKRTIAMCREFEKRGFDIAWWCQSRADTLVKNAEMTARMAESGCVTCFLGLESGNEKTLTAFNKRSSTDVGRRAVRTMNENGIGAYGAFIIGADDETEPDIMNTISYATSINLNTAQFSILTPYPGTDIFRDLKHRLVTFNWSLYDGAHALYNTRHLSIHQLNGLLKKAYRTFYLRPTYLLDGVKRLPFSALKSLLGYVRNSRKDISDELYRQTPNPVYDDIDNLSRQFRISNTFCSAPVPHGNGIALEADNN